MAEPVPSKEKLPDWLRRWYCLKGEPRFREAADEIERLQRELASFQKANAELALSHTHEPDPVPPKEPTPEWVLKARAEGRAEFLSILLGESAEDFANDYTGTHSIGCTGDYGVHWEVEKLRASFVVDDATYSYIDTINGNWWSQQHQIETLQEELEELKRASQPPTVNEDSARLDFLDSQRKWGDCFMAQDLDSGDVYVRPWRSQNQARWPARIVASDIRTAIDLARATATKGDGHE
jgi:hypothetical protein